jgi:hypothetical protein
VHDVEQGTGGRGLVLATGAVAAVVVAMMVITLTPRRSPAPTAAMVTTIPPANVELQSDAAPTIAGDEPARASTGVETVGFEQVGIRGTPLAGDEIVALTAIPNAVSAAPIEEADDIDMAGGEPRANDPVLLLTPSHTYRVRWADVERLHAPDGAIVITEDGGLVASFFDGEMAVLVGP